METRLHIPAPFPGKTFKLNPGRLFLTLLCTLWWFFPQQANAQCITVDAGEDQYVCSTPTQVTLDGSISGNYISFNWTPTTGMTGATTLSPTINVSQSGTYILKAKGADYGTNLVDNGDFEQGNTGFSTDYNYNPNFAGFPFGSYDVAPYAVPLTHCPDHTSGSGNYMCVDGAEFPNELVWCQTVPVTPNTDYLLSTWVTSINLVPLFANLEFTINGVQVGNTFGAPPQCAWTQFTGIWNSGPNTSATICIEDLTVTGANNDFGLDDIGLYPICTDADTVKVNVVNIVAIANPAVGLLPCNGANFTLNGTGSSVGPQITYQWDTPNGNIVSGGNTLQPVVNAAGAYTLTVSYDFGNGQCTKTATVNIIDTPNPLTTWINPPPILGCGSNQVVLNGFSNQGAVNFAWTTVGGNIVSGGNTQNATINQAGVYTLTTTNFITGCTSTATVTVQSGNNPPTAVANALGTVTCAQTQVGLSGQGSTTGAGIIYSWTTPNGIIISGQDSLHAIAGAAGTYILSVSNTISNCITHDTVTVSGNTVLPVATIQPSGPITCAVDTLTLSATLSPLGAQPVWTAVSGGVIVSGGNTASPQVTSAGIYLLTVTNPANGCSATVQDTVLANLTAPIAVAQAPDTLSCQLPQAMLSGAGSSSGPGFVYQWSGGSIISGGTTLSPLVGSAAQYTLLVTDTLNGCSSDTSVWLLADTSLVFALAAAPDTLSCLAASIILDATGSSGGTIFSWTTSTGQIISGANTATPQVGQPGIYNLLVSNPSNGCSATDSVTVVQDIAPPDIQFQLPQSFTCDMQSQTLLAQVLNAGSYAYSWSASNGGTLLSGSDTPSPLIGSPGTYTLLVTNILNGCTNTQLITVSADQSVPVANVATPGVITCAAPQLILDGSASSAGPGISYQWTATSGGVIFSGNNSAMPVVTAAGDYHLLVLNAANGCTTTATVQVTADVQVPDATVSAPALITCLQPTEALSVLNPVPGLAYQWQTSDGQIISGQNSAAIMLGSGGTYSLTVTDPQNGCSATNTVVVAENTQTPAFQIQAPLILNCIVTSQTLVAQPSAPAQFDYSWTGANGGTIVTGADTPTPLVSTVGDYVLQVTDQVNGCTNTQTVTVTADSVRPVAAIAGTGVINCTTPQLTLDGGGSSSGPGITYLWTTMNGGTILSGANTQAVLVSSSGNYLLQVTNNTNGCSAVTSVQVTDDLQIPSAAIITPGLFTCVDLTDTLYAFNPSAGLNYQWQTIGGQILSGQNTPALAIASAGNYSLTVNNPVNGCSAMSSVQVLPDANTPSASIAAPDTLNCLVTTINLNANGSAGPTFTYAWTGSGLVSGAGSLTPTVDAPGMYTLLVTNNSNGCTAQAVVNVAANTTAPLVAIATPNLLNCQITNTSLSASPVGNGYAFQWTAGTGGNILSGATSSNPIVDAPGTYDLTVTDVQNGCTASASTLVGIDQAPPVLSVAPPSVLTCTIPAIGLIGSVQSPVNGYSVQWTTGNGNFLDGQNTLNPTVNAPGIYEMTVQNQLNGCTASAMVNVAADQINPTVSAGSAVNISCADPQITLNGTAMTNLHPVSQQWTGPSVLSGANSLSPLIGAPGVYTMLVVDLFNGCTAAASVTVGADTSHPTVAVLSPPTLTCVNLSATLDASGSSQGPEFSLLWTTLDGHFAAGQNSLSPTVDAPGHYNLVIKNQQNGCQSSALAAVPQNFQPPFVDAGAAQILHCNQLQANLQGSSSSTGVSYQWAASAGGQIVSGANTAAPIVNAAGTYTLTVTRLDNGCTAADSTLVRSIPNPDFATEVDQPDCHSPSGSVAIINISGGAPPFSVSSDGGLNYQNSLVFNGLPQGAYDMVLQDGHGCTATQSVALQAPELPVVQLSPSFSIALGDSIMLIPTVTPLAVAEWHWSPAEGLSCSDCAEPVVHLLRSQSYHLVVIDPNGCTATATTRVLVDRRRQIYAPNIFSPNEDGHNDWFTLFGRGVTDVCDLQIYDRWGSLVWSREHLPINVEPEGWDGQIGSQAAAPGVYVWRAVITFVDGETEVFAGDITLLR